MEAPDLLRQHDPTEQDDQNSPDFGKGKKLDDKAMKDFNRRSVERVNKGEKAETILAELRQLKKSGEEALDEVKKQHPFSINDRQYMDYSARLRETKNPDEAQAIIDEIKQRPEEHEKEVKTRIAENEKLPLDHEEIDKKGIQKIEEKFRDPQMIAWLGTKQVDAFRDWCIYEIKQDPTIKTVKRVFDDIENHRNGPKPRREFYEQTLEPFLRDRGLKLSDTPYFEAEGLSERKAALDLAKDTAKELEGMRQTGLYSHTVVDSIMKDLLKQPTQGRMQEMHDRVGKLIDKESSNYQSDTSSIFKNTRISVQVGGQTFNMQAMSDKSRQEYLKYYRDTDLHEREQQVLNWPKIIENEGKLAKKLGEIYQDDPEGFRKVHANFEELDYFQKEKFIADQEELKKHNDQETLSESNEIVGQSLRFINEKRDKKIICGKTANRFRDLFRAEKYTDPKTKKIDLKKLQKMKEDLMSPTPVEEQSRRNIAAYEKEHEKFTGLLKKFQKDNPDIPEEEIRKWRERYEDGSWHVREDVMRRFTDESAKQEKERERRKHEQEKAGITEAQKKEAEKKSPKLTKLLEYVEALIEENTAVSLREAWQHLLLFEENQEDKYHLPAEFHDAVARVNEKRRLVSLEGGKDKQTSEAKTQEIARKVVRSEKRKQKVDQANIMNLAAKQTRLNEQRHGNLRSVEDRAKRESMERAGNDTEKREFIEEYYDLTGEMGQDFVLSREQETGQKVNEIKFNDVAWTKENLQAQKEDMREHQSRITKNTGFSHVRLVNKQGQEIGAEEGVRESQQDINVLEQEMLEEASGLANLQKKAKDGNEAVDINDRVRMMRAIRREREEKQKEIPRRNAA